MKKLLYTILLIALIQLQASALDIVYPTKEYSKVNAPASFIIGSVMPFERLYINDSEIEVHKTGAFAKAVKLQAGKNEFKIDNGRETKTYIIERPLVGGSYKPAVFNKYLDKKVVEVTREGAPMRSTSVQSGINRLSHFQKGLQLSVDGELGDMYRVYLSPKQSAWVAKSDVKLVNANFERAFLFDFRGRETADCYIYEFALSKKTPYSLSEGDIMQLKIYNVSANIDNTAVFKITLNQRLMGYDIRYKGDTLVLKIKKEPKFSRKTPLKNIKVVVDAGHGGRELGAIGCCRNYEKDFNLSIAKYLQEYLQKMGANVYMTRHTDRFMSLNDRVKYTNTRDAQIFVSIHANSLPDVVDPMSKRGSSVFYYYEEAKPLSDAILNSVIRKMDVNNDGVHQASFAVVRNTSAVSVLVETAYIINPYDNELLMNDSFRQKYAEAIADGIKDYVVQNRTRTSWFSKSKVKCVKV